MEVYVITTNYFQKGYFGIYSTLKRARIAFEDFIGDDEDIVSFENSCTYYYHFTTKNGEVFSAEIQWEVIDEEFLEGIVKEDK